MSLHTPYSRSGKIKPVLINTVFSLVLWCSKIKPFRIIGLQIFDCPFLNLDMIGTNSEQEILFY